MKISRVTKINGKLETTQIEAAAPIYNVRIKLEIYEPLALLAAKEHRSVTAHINYLLEQSLAKR